MGWLLGLALFVTGINKGDPIIFVAAGLFAVAGSIATSGVKKQEK